MFKYNVTTKRLIYDGGEIKADTAGTPHHVVLDKVNSRLKVGDAIFPLVPTTNFKFEADGEFTVKDGKLLITSSFTQYTPNIVQLQTVKDTRAGQTAFYSIQHGSGSYSLNNLSDNHLKIEHVKGESLLITAINVATGATTTQLLNPVAGQKYRIVSESESERTGEINIIGGEVNVIKEVKEECVRYDYEPATDTVIELPNLLVESRLSMHTLEAPIAYDSPSAPTTWDRVEEDYRSYIRARKAPADGRKAPAIPEDLILPHELSDRYLHLAPQRVAGIEDEKGVRTMIQENVPVPLPAGTYTLFLPTPHVGEYKNNYVGNYRHREHWRLTQGGEDTRLTLTHTGMQEDPSSMKPHDGEKLVVTEQDVADGTNYVTLITEFTKRGETYRHIQDQTPMPVWEQFLIFTSWGYAIKYVKRLDIYTQLHIPRKVVKKKLACVESRSVEVIVGVENVPIQVVDTRKQEDTIRLMVEELN